MLQEPQYFDCDEDGYSPEDRKSRQIQKWRQTQTQFQVDVLAIFGMTYFPTNDRDAKTDLVEIERGMTPLSSIPNINKALQDDRTVHPYPKEWVDFAINWTKEKRNQGIAITLRSMINFIRNKERMINWLEKNQKFTFKQEKKYETRKEVLELSKNNTTHKELMEEKNASLETKYADYGD